jgi:hypothetical protein
LSKAIEREKIFPAPTSNPSISGFRVNPTAICRGFFSHFISRLSKKDNTLIEEPATLFCYRY